MHDLYEVLAITSGGESLMRRTHDRELAFTLCCDLWAARKAGGSVYAVRDCQTDQRWSYRDIQDLAALPGAAS